MMEAGKFAFVAGLLGVLAAGIEDTDNNKLLENQPRWFGDSTNEGFAVKSFLAMPHIIGGNEAVPHSYPHQVFLDVLAEGNGSETKQYLCGGSLLTDSWVLTAAHCVNKESIFRYPKAELLDTYKLEITVAAGVHNTSNATDVQQSKVSQIIVHPQSARLLKNDIALLKMEKKFVLNEYVKPIRLPKLSQQSELFEGSRVTMIGWGKTSRKEKTIANTLQTVESTVISNFYCNFRYLFLLVRDTNICVSCSGSKGTGKGDSGGPLIITEADGEPTLIGVSSFGLGCIWGTPSAFTRVTSYLNWIHGTVGIPPRP